MLAKAKEIQRYMRDNECSVCYEPIEESDVVKQGGVRYPKNAVWCSNRHSTCVDCVRKLVTAAPCCRGFQYLCPICRGAVCLDKFELMTVIKGDANELLKMFDCANQANNWVHGH